MNTKTMNAINNICCDDLILVAQKENVRLYYSNSDRIIILEDDNTGKTVCLDDDFGAASGVAHDVGIMTADNYETRMMVEVIRDTEEVPDEGSYLVDSCRREVLTILVDILSDLLNVLVPDTYEAWTSFLLLRENISPTFDRVPKGFAIRADGVVQYTRTNTESGYCVVISYDPKAKVWSGAWSRVSVCVFHTTGKTLGELLEVMEESTNSQILVQ